jgi:hypothetical protein
MEQAPHIFSSVLSFCNEWLEKSFVILRVCVCVLAVAVFRYVQCFSIDCPSRSFRHVVCSQHLPFSMVYLVRRIPFA